MSLLRRLRALFDHAELSKEIDDELAAHIEMRTADNVAAGMPPKAARRDALLRFGNTNIVREKVVAVDAALTLESIWADLRLAIRRLSKSRGFTFTAVLTLALGIGANTAVFSIVQAVLLRPLPYKNPERLVVVWQADSAHRSVGGWFNAYQEFEVWRENSRSFEKLAPLTWAAEGNTVLWKNNPVDIFPLPTGVDFFEVLGVPASIGRTFLKRDLSDVCTLVLSHHFWTLKLGAPSGIIGQTLTMGGTSCEVIGVMPRDFSFYPLQADAWRLITPSSEFALKPWTSMTGVFGLLKPNVTRSEAEAELATLQARITPEAPAQSSMLRTMSPVVLDLQSNFTWLAGRNLRTALWVLWGAVLIILLMACINIATLLLGRVGERSLEMAVRTALGSGRVRLFSQLFTEVLLLALAGTTAGLVITTILLSWFRSASPIELPPGNVIMLDWRVFLFSSMLGLICALIAGVVPAWRGSQVDLNSVLKTGERGQGASSSAQRVSQLFIVLQVALSLTLLTAASLFGKSLVKLSSTDLGYRTSRLLTGSIKLPPSRYAETASRSRFVASFSEGLASEGIPDATLASDVTPRGMNVLAIEGSTSTDKAQDGVASQDVAASFFRLMQIRLLRGRSFDTRDRADKQQAVIINEALAKKFFEKVDPIGRTLKLTRAEDQSEPWLTIVGVVADVKTSTVFQDMGFIQQPAIYRPLSQHPPSSLMVIVPTEEDVAAITGRIQHELSQIDKDLLLKGIETVEHKQSMILSQPRFRAALFGGFAVIALVLSMVGLYGVLLQAVLQRTREIGIRMASGADREQILCSVLGRALGLISVGLGLGVMGSIGCGVFLKALLYGVSAQSPLVLAMASSAMLLIGMAAAFQPAFRASSIDPVRALR